MRLLYFEDDAIDQRLFKRACKNLTDVEFTFYDSCLGLKEEYINSYDGIIIDQYLRDCSVVQFQDKNITTPMAVLSASETLQGSEDGFLGVWQKPIKENVLQDILKKIKAIHKKPTSVVSLEYINDLTQGDEAEKQELLESIYQSIEENNQSLENANSLAVDALQQCLHKQKSKVGIFYLEELHRTIDQAENKLKNGEAKKSVLPSVVEIVKETRNILVDLKTHIK